MKKFIPILFSTPMVKAILEGRKTMTRRIVKPQPSIKMGVGKWLKNNIIQMVGSQEVVTSYMLKHCQYQPGDILWVRETFYGYNEEDENRYVYFADTRDARPWDLSDAYCINEWGSMNKDMWPKWKPSLFMPKAACRIFLEVTDVKVERLQDINSEDAKAEGANDWMKVDDMKMMAGLGNWLIPSPFSGHQFGFLSIWCKINGCQSWLDNPWVWVVTFKKIEKPENFI